MSERVSIVFLANVEVVVVRNLVREDCGLQEKPCGFVTVSDCDEGSKERL